MLIAMNMFQSLIFSSLIYRYTASSAVVGKAGKECKGELPLIRIRARYQTVQILPMDTYHDLIQVTYHCYLITIAMKNAPRKDYEKLCEEHDRTYCI